MAMSGADADKAIANLAIITGPASPLSDQPNQTAGPEYQKS
jgi:hypothetical protein